MFRSTFDGNGHKVTVKLDKRMNEGTNCVGLFGVVGDFGIIRNLGVEGSVTAIGGEMNFAGGIAGISGMVSGNYASSLIENCYSTCNITAENCMVGGISGYGNTTRNCCNTGNLKGEGSYVYVGGIIAYSLGGPMENCYNTGNITVEDGLAAWVGGAAGVGSTIKNCFNIGDINVNCMEGCNGGASGGIAGCVNDSCSSCYNVGALSVSGNAEEFFVGGIAGIAEGSMKSCYNVGAIKVEDENAILSGMCGKVDGGATIDNCYCHKGTATKIVGSKGNGTVKNCGFKIMQQITNGNLVSDLNSTQSSTFKYAGNCLPPLYWQTEDTYVRVNDELGKVLCGFGGEDIWRYNKAKNTLAHTLKPNPGYKVAGIKEGADGIKYGSFKIV